MTLRQHDGIVALQPRPSAVGLSEKRRRAGDPFAGSSHAWHRLVRAGKSCQVEFLVIAQ